MLHIIVTSTGPLKM